MHTDELSPKEFKALLFLRDELLYRHRSPTYRALGAHVGLKSPRSAYLLVQRLMEKGYLERASQGGFRLAREFGGAPTHERTVEVPLVGAAPCGNPLLAEENIEAMIPVSQGLAKPGASYFLLRALGDSMDRAGIEDGSLALVRQQSTAEEGDRVVALLDDSATIKEFRRKGGKVLLMPRSSNPRHKPLILQEDFLIQGVVVDTLPNPLE